MVNDYLNGFKVYMLVVFLFLVFSDCYFILLLDVEMFYGILISCRGRC